MDRFKQIIDGGYQGFQTGDARQIIRDSAEVTQYVYQKRGHFAYVQQLMNDKIIDEAMGRVKGKGYFEYDGDGAFTYRPGVYHTTNYSRQILAEEYPSQPVYPEQQNRQYNPQTGNYQPDSVMNRLEAMEREIANLRIENQELKTRYEQLK